MNRIELRCEICNGKFDTDYNIPKVLNCGHTVCAKCVERMKDKNINKCPFDRKALDFDDDKIAINYYILSLIDTSVKEPLNLSPQEEEETFEFNPKPVVNSPGWKNTLDGFIFQDVLHTVETNGFIYCTDLNSGEWWFMYHNQFFGNFFFEILGKMYLIDQYGSMFQVFNKNYYIQIGKKNAWKNTTQMCIFENNLYTIESSKKLFLTDLLTGKMTEVKVKNKDETDFEENDSKIFKGTILMIPKDDKILFSNKLGELNEITPKTGEVKLLKSDYSKNIESFAYNSNYAFFFEKNSKTIFKTLIKEEDESTLVNAITDLKDQSNNSKLNDLNLYKTEVFMELDSIVPSKLIADDKRLVIIDKNGEIHSLLLETKQTKNFQCLFMLRNCHLQNTALIGDGDLLLLDPIRSSLNKLNIIAGTEVIVLHSTKFLYSIKNIISANSKIYFIDISGNLYSFNESEKKLTQIGNNAICKNITDFAVFKNYLLTVEAGSLYRTNLSDGTYTEVKNEQTKAYEHFFADNQSVVFINNKDEINVYNFVTDNSIVSMKLKTTFKFENLTKATAITLFRNQLIFYVKDKKTIETFNLEDGTHKRMVENFNEISQFINNHDFLACILKDGVIYKLYC